MVSLITFLFLTVISSLGIIVSPTYMDGTREERDILSRLNSKKLIGLIFFVVISMIINI